MIGDLLRGALAGTAATSAMDQVTTAMLSAQPREVTLREEAARVGGRSAVGNMVERLDASFELALTSEQKERLGTVVHYALGAGPGAIYALLRRRVPLVGAGGGLVYGLLLWALNDEYLNTRLGLSGGRIAPPLLQVVRPTSANVRG